MFWFVIYATGVRSRARVQAPHAGPPRSGKWREWPLAPGAGMPGRSVRRYTALLEDPEWTELCEELGLDLEAACGDLQRCGFCELSALPGLALEVPGAPELLGAAVRVEGGLCVAPLPESDAERERVRSLFATAAFNVGRTDAELRCPDCASPELRWLGGAEREQQMACGNCGARLARESAFLRLGDLEAILATTPPPRLAAAAMGGLP